MSVGEGLYFEDSEFALELNLLDKRRELIIMLEDELEPAAQIQSPPPSALPVPVWAESELGSIRPGAVDRWLQLSQELRDDALGCSTTVQEFFKYFDYDIISKDCRSELL